MRKKSKRVKSYLRDEPLRLSIIGCTSTEHAMNQMAMATDRIEAALSLIEEIDIHRRCVWIGGRLYELMISPKTGEIHIKPSVQQAAAKFGLNKHEVKRFYDLTCQRIRAEVPVNDDSWDLKSVQ